MSEKSPSPYFDYSAGLDKSIEAKSVILYPEFNENNLLQGIRVEEDFKADSPAVRVPDMSESASPSNSKSIVEYDKSVAQPAREVPLIPGKTYSEEV